MIVNKSYIKYQGLCLNYKVKCNDKCNSMLNTQIHSSKQSKGQKGVLKMMNQRM